MAQQRYKQAVQAIKSTPWQRLTEAEVRSVARQLDGTDVDDLVDRLDELSVEKFELPEWDGDSQDDVANVQETLALILMHLAKDNHEAIAARIDGSHELTRQYLALALNPPLG